MKRKSLIAIVIATILILLGAIFNSASAAWSFAGKVRGFGHGVCDISQSPGATNAVVRCNDGWRKSFRPCPDESSSNCFWHAAARGSSGGESFIDINGRVYYIDILVEDN